MVTPGRLRLCLVTDPDLGRPRRLDDIVLAAVAGGVTLVQLRDKAASTRALVETAARLKALLAPTGVPLIINDRADVALAAGVAGVHLGQRDLPAGLARRMLGADAIIGLSIETVGQESAAEAAFADYLGVGPVYATGTKADAAVALGLTGLRAVRAATLLPIVAIGGIDAARATAAVAAGADGVAVVSAVMAAPDPEAAARALSAAVAAGFRTRPGR